MIFIPVLFRTCIAKHCIFLLYPVVCEVENCDGCKFDDTCKKCSDGYKLNEEGQCMKGTVLRGQTDMLYHVTLYFHWQTPNGDQMRAFHLWIRAYTIFFFTNMSFHWQVDRGLSVCVFSFQYALIINVSCVMMTIAALNVKRNMSLMIKVAVRKVSNAMHAIQYIYMWHCGVTSNFSVTRFDTDYDNIILSGLCLRLSQLSESSCMQYMGLWLFSLPTSLMIIVRICALYISLHLS